MFPIELGLCWYVISPVEVAEPLSVDAIKWVATVARVDARAAVAHVVNGHSIRLKGGRTAPFLDAYRI